MAASPETRQLPWPAETSVRRTQKRTVRYLAAAQIVGGVGVGVASSLSPLLAEQLAQSTTLAGPARTATTAGAAAIGARQPPPEHLATGRAGTDATRSAASSRTVSWPYGPQE